MATSIFPSTPLTSEQEAWRSLYPIISLTSVAKMLNTKNALHLNITVSVKSFICPTKANTNYSKIIELLKTFKTKIIAPPCFGLHKQSSGSSYLIFVVPCITLYSGEISPTRCNNCVFYSQWLYSTCFG